MINNYRYLIISDAGYEGTSPVVAYADIENAIKAAQELSTIDTHCDYKIIDMQLLTELQEKEGFKTWSSIQWWKTEITYG